MVPICASWQAEEPVGQDCRDLVRQATLPLGHLEDFNTVRPKGFPICVMGGCPPRPTSQRMDSNPRGPTNDERGPAMSFCKMLASLPSVSLPSPDQRGSNVSHRLMQDPESLYHAGPQPPTSDFRECVTHWLPDPPHLSKLYSSTPTCILTS